MKYQKEIEESISFIIATKRIKYTRINLRRKKKCIHKIINYKMKEIKEDINSGEIFHIPGLEESIL